MCYVTGRLGDGVTDTLKAKTNKHSTSRALRKKQREEPTAAIWMQVDEITDTHSSAVSAGLSDLLHINTITHTCP